MAGSRELCREHQQPVHGDCRINGSSKIKQPPRCSIPPAKRCSNPLCDWILRFVAFEHLKTECLIGRCLGFFVEPAASAGVGFNSIATLMSAAGMIAEEVAAALRLNVALPDR